MKKIRAWWYRRWHRIAVDRDEREQASEMRGERAYTEALRSHYASQARVFTLIQEARDVLDAMRAARERDEMLRLQRHYELEAKILALRKKP